MTERTYNIIMACKQVAHGDVIEAVKEYMSKECDVPIEEYTQSQMSKIMKTAMFDYLDSCDNPSVFAKYLMEVDNYFDHVSLGEKIALAFRSVRVKKGDTYINGFGEWVEKGCAK